MAKPLVDWVAAEADEGGGDEGTSRGNPLEQNTIDWLLCASGYKRQLQECVHVSARSLADKSAYSPKQFHWT